MVPLTNHSPGSTKYAFEKETNPYHAINRGNDRLNDMHADIHLNILACKATPTPAEQKGTHTHAYTQEKKKKKKSQYE